jgi:hypothetical protein
MSIHAMARELGEKMLDGQMIIVANTRGRIKYSGPMLGILEKNGDFHAAQSLGDNHTIPHDASKDELPALKALIGQEVEIKGIPKTFPIPRVYPNGWRETGGRVGE